MCLVDGGADVAEQLVIVMRAGLAVAPRDERHVHHGLGQAEQRVDPREPIGRQVDLLVAIDRPALVLREHPEAVVAAPDVAVPVELEHVAQLAIDHDAADRPARVVREVLDRLGIAVLLDELAQRELDRQLLQLVLVVQGERVVHVEPDHLDRVHAEVPVTEHAVLPRNVDLRGGLTQKRAELRFEVRGRNDHSGQL